MTEPQCPVCLGLLTHTSEDYECTSCGTHYRERLACPTCKQPVEILKACGAVSYFCNTCNSLCSKHDIERTYVRSNNI